MVLAALPWGLPLALPKMEKGGHLALGWQMRAETPTVLVRLHHGLQHKSEPVRGHRTAILQKCPPGHTGGPS